jgi:glutamine synthetase
MSHDHSVIFAKISDRIKKHNLLKTVCARLKQEFGLLQCLGVEIEFYLSNEYSGSDLKAEKGKYQYEIDLPPKTDMFGLIQDIEDAKKHLQIAHPDINFHPKPFIDDYGSAMHFHINFLGGDGSNYFDDDQNISHVANSLCHYLIPTFFIFAPTTSHYVRYEGLMAPTHVCWGPNNRTVAIRIPNEHPRRLEHRISSPMTDCHLAIFAILQSIYLGLKYPLQIKHYAKIYGNAFDTQYHLTPLPKSAEEAMLHFSEDFLMKF